MLYYAAGNKEIPVQAAEQKHEKETYMSELNKNDWSGVSEVFDCGTENFTENDPDKLRKDRGSADPDFIPIAGFVDDATVFALLVSACHSELDACKKRQIGRRM